MGKLLGKPSLFSTPSFPEMPISPEMILDDNKDLLETVSEGVLKELFEAFSKEGISSSSSERVPVGALTVDGTSADEIILNNTGGRIFCSSPLCLNPDLETREVKGKLCLKNLDTTLDKLIEKSPQIEIDNASRVEAEVLVENHIGYTQTETSVQNVIDDSLLTFIPSYKEILNRTPLYRSTWGGGGLPSTSSKDKKSVKKEGEAVCRILCEPSTLKGVVFGGLENDFSPLKMRSARKLGKEKENTGLTSMQVLEGPRALRAQKSLARVKK
jgi:hypothetical protein